VLARAAKRNGLGRFVRLPATRKEAQAIQQLAGAQSTLVLQGQQATREAVLSGRLNRYDILHFATHGVVDLEEPALSGLVLAGVDLDGQPASRFLRSQEIAGLQLSARLVVLSACETGIGRSIRGEGVLGLSRAFFYAGAKQVLSTLWQVPDRATYELMRHFYKELLENGLSASDALRAAQNQLRANPRWRSEFYWGAFVLHGDWRS
jgi:CHAT domain-containing protein